MTVFDVFTNTPYEFLQVSRGEVYGNRILSTAEARGVFKLRDGMVQANDQELRQSDATIHIKPNGEFLAAITVDGVLDIVGHGIRHNNIDYEIKGCTGGDNFETGIREHYRLTLERTDYSEFASAP